MRLTPSGTIGGHDGPIEPPAFSPDGRRLVSGDAAGWLVARMRVGGEFREIARVQVPAAGPYSKPQVRAVVWPTAELVVTHEYGAVRIRLAGAGLAAAHEQPHVGTGKIAAGGGSTWVGVLSDDSVYVLDLPSLNYRAVVTPAREDYEYFNVTALAADPAGSLLAVSDDGGADETSMGVRTAVGEPQVTLADATTGAVVAAIERGTSVHRLAWDPWRGRIIVATFGDVGVWSPAGEPIHRLGPYEGTYARAVAVSEHWIATAGQHDYARATLDLWHPTTFAPLASADLPLPVASDWIVAAPDGHSLLTPALPVAGEFAMQLWSVDE